MYLGTSPTTPPGLEVGAHAFTALLAMLASVVMLALVYVRSQQGVKKLAMAVALLVWLTWFLAIPTYTVWYTPDKEAIKANPATKAAHVFGMETKEHIFYTGLLLATLLPIVAHTVDLKSDAGRRLVMSILTALIVGGMVMNGLGAWVTNAAKQAWALKGG